MFEEAGHRTQRTGPDPDDPNAGFQFGLGHGVGLEVHEEPGLGRLGWAPLVAGDVIAIEPGLWERGIGGVRFEDLLLVNDDGVADAHRLRLRRLTPAGSPVGVSASPRRVIRTGRERERE